VSPFREPPSRPQERSFTIFECFVLEFDRYAALGQRIPVDNAADATPARGDDLSNT
jgi:transposase